MGIQKNSILIVDDDYLNIMALSHILSDYIIYVEKDGQGCINSARELKPDLILLDIIMPEMSGFDVIQVLKEDGETHDIPVVFITGCYDPTDEERGFNLGASDFISKPYNASVIKLRIKNQIRIVNQILNIKKLSITDVLTGISNRRHFNAVLTQEWNRSLRNQTSIGLMIIDIDNFRAYNATYGHLRGDIALKEIAYIIEEKLRGTLCQFARWGGEEFSVVLPNMDIDEIYSIAAEIQNTINNHGFVRDGVSSNISVSIGINAFNPLYSSDYQLDSFVSNTTEAICRSKNRFHKSPGGQIISSTKTQINLSIGRDSYEQF